MTYTLDLPLACSQAQNRKQKLDQTGSWCYGLFGSKAGMNVASTPMINKAMQWQCHSESDGNLL